MAFWRRGHQPNLPVSRQLVVALPTLFHLEIERGLTFRSEKNLTFDKVWHSLFFATYVAGYPMWVEQDYPDAAAIYRQDLMQCCFGDFCDPSVLNDRIGAEHAAGNELVRLGGAMGNEDGKAGFEALLTGSSPPAAATRNLFMAVRGLSVIA